MILNTFDANFIANAGVKDIVGRGLIYNDNVAIIELVKNSKDANSKKVILEFNNPVTKSEDLGDLLEGSDLAPEIIIKDFGSGMSKDDLKTKWLNIAYSEKKALRDKVYAGNKGVGRFSCDRLGKHLELYTKTKGGECLRLKIKWELFEDKDKQDEISKIPLVIEVLTEDELFLNIGESKFESGTVLKIQGLRSIWSEQKFKKLISDLEKFTPELDSTFEIHLNSNGVFKDKELAKKFNTKVSNNILEKLAFKTIFIKSTISANGSTIETTLYYQNQQVYKYKSENPYRSLKNISIEVHYLDSITKSYFTRNVGVQSNSYGSVFLFYNSFRISPYGNEKNDWLGLDQRKSQGTARYFGTRDIVGRINILDLDNSFSVITSREGLAHNNAYLDLVAHDSEEKTRLKSGKEEYGYAITIIRQLENFVVKGLDWNRLLDTTEKLKSVSSEDLLKDPDRFKSKKLSSELVQEVCSKIIQSNVDITEFEINNGLIEEIENINKVKYESFLNDFLSKAKDKTIKELTKHQQFTVKKIVEEQNKKIEKAEEQKKQAEKKASKVTQELQVEKKQNAYLMATRRTLSPDADGLIHTIKINNIEINEGIETLIEGISYDEYSKEDIISKLSSLKLYSLKSLKMTELATRSGFDNDIDVRNVEVIKYIDEYLGIYKSTFGSNGLTISVGAIGKPFIKSLSLLNFSVVLDNLLSNSSKWGASEFKYSSSCEGNELNILFSDNGEGLSDIFLNDPEQIFKLGVRDEPPEECGGSGIGLHYTRKLLAEMGAEITFVGNGVDLKGATFKVVFKNI
ncbi:sensor histidine kinase [Pseudoalteromonas nigrifaciens]|uniref:sensor histidine kinase n=1 Tax=Pseudoalteromonas nigrifaciens TaxID=28109 RepID=UPI001787A16F|nr:ATP-binding protein [Pseudoalteromonas nigrifaciens]MBE0421766.1 ATP-binding protein [Pseudoalteromonas nigrifaciens]